MRATMGFAHDGYHRYSTGCADGFHLEVGDEFVFVGFGDGGDDLDDFGGFGDAVLAGDLVDELDEGDGEFGLVEVDELGDDLGDGFEGGRGGVFDLGLLGGGGGGGGGGGC